MTALTWEEFDALECKCKYRVIKPVKGAPKCARCTKCGGWGAITVQYLNDADAAHEVFKKKKPQ